MSELWSIVEEHSREYGPTTSAIARRMGTTSQTLFNWRDRELREMPHRDTLRALSRVTRRPLESVIAAAVADVYGLSEDAYTFPVAAKEGEPEPGEHEDE